MSLICHGPVTRHALSAPGPAKPLSDAPAAVRTVVDMYSKCHVDEAAFSPHVTFEDPAALTVGIAELQEAFRALGALQPENLGWKLASSDGSTRVTEVDIWQRYIIGTRPVELYARVQVTCGSNGRIVSLKDLWNGTELLMPPPFPYVRRINGAVSSVVTPMLIRNNNPTADD